MVTQATLRKAIKRILVETALPLSADSIRILVVNDTGFDYGVEEVIDCLHELADDDEIVTKVTYTV